MNDYRTCERCGMEKGRNCFPLVKGRRGKRCNPCVMQIKREKAVRAAGTISEKGT